MHSDLSETPSPTDGITQPRLNILALPSFTAILFGLMAFVILAAVFSSMLPDSKFWWPPLVFGVVLLTLRDFLRVPQREQRRAALQLGQEMAPLEDALAELSQQSGERVPQLMAIDRQAIWSFGTFRRRFIAVGRETGVALSTSIVRSDSRSANAAQAILAHELAHFTNGDIQLAGLARSLLKITFLVAFFIAWIAIGMIALMVQIGPEVTSAAFWAELTQRVGLPGVDLGLFREMLRAQYPALFDQLADPAKAAAIGWFSMSYYVSALLPFMISTAFLYIFLWRKLMRVREFYADARAAETISGAGSNGIVATVDAMILMGTLGSIASAPVSGMRQRIVTARRGLASSVDRGLLAFRPSDPLLKQALDDPIIAFGRPWQIAVWTGIAILLLELMFRGSLTAMIIYQPGPHLPLITAIAVFAFWLLPQVCSGVPGRSLAGMAMPMALIFTLIKLSLNFADALVIAVAYLAGQLGSLGRMLDLWACTIVGGCGDVTPFFIGPEFTWGQIVRWHIVTPIAYYLFFALPLLVSVLLLDARCKRWALTWYRLGAAVKRVLWAVTGMLLVLVLLVVVPIGNRIFFPWIYEDWPAPVLAGMALGALVVLAAGLWFAISHRRLAGRCRRCGETIPGSFELALTCPSCGAVQHSWLLAPQQAPPTVPTAADETVHRRARGRPEPLSVGQVEPS